MDCIVDGLGLLDEESAELEELLATEFVRAGGAGFEVVALIGNDLEGVGACFFSC